MTDLFPHGWTLLTLGLSLLAFGLSQVWAWHELRPRRRLSRRMRRILNFY